MNGRHDGKRSNLNFNSLTASTSVSNTYNFALPYDNPTLSTWTDDPLLSRFNVNFDASVEEWDPDELFTKHTVAEVKLIQQRLRDDADAKQEELRLMVGERYRDLLQASTSIISISESSKRVVTTLSDMQCTAASGESVHSPKAALSGQGDSQLQTLQSLAAHMKLLLDAPEHLWRLLERKLYLYAAWLFLLSRVVHHSLLRDHDEDDAPWVANGINIDEQFPLVQRQWDAVSQFRSQITQKATSSLRESASTPVEVCATLLTLHLLDVTSFARNVSNLSISKNPNLIFSPERGGDRVPNDNASRLSKPTSDSGPLRSRKVVIRDVRQKLKAVLEVVSRTLGTARTIFIEIPGKPSSLMRDVLDHIQADDTPTATDLPVELRITTQSLLSTLPSANHFLLLPPNVRSYRPYVDGNSLSIPAASGQFQQRLGEWFLKALEQVQQALETWFADLQSIREVWQVRKWVGAWIQRADGFHEQERIRIVTVLDSICKQRAIAVWKAGLDSTVTTFRTRLESSLSQLRSSELDTHPVQYLFRASPLPPIQAPNLSSAKLAFQKFKDKLQSQISCRTPLLDDVLSAIEDGVKALHEDIAVTHEDKTAASPLVSELTLQYRQDTGQLCNSVSKALEASLCQSSGDVVLSLQCLTFIGRVAIELSTSSTILASLDCEPNTLDEFRTKLKEVSKKATMQRQKHDIAVALETYHESILKLSSSHKSAPSSALIEALLSLADSLQQVGSLLDVVRQTEWAPELLNNFAGGLVLALDKQHPVKKNLAQYLYDLAFLLRISSSWGSTTEATSNMLRAKLAELSGTPERSSTTSSNITDMAEHLSRMQHLLGVLLPSSSSHVSQEKSSSLLQFGSPSSENQYQPTLQLVKPSARFGRTVSGNRGMLSAGVAHARDNSSNLSYLSSVYFGIHMAGGHIGLPILVLLFFCSRRIYRPATVINFCIVWIIYSVSYSLIIYGGHHRTLNPPFKLCLVQASMIHGASPMAAVAGLEVVFQAWSTFTLPWQSRLYPSFVFKIPKWLLIILIVSPPYIVFLTFSIATALIGLQEPEKVFTSDSLHCTLHSKSNSFQRFAVPLFCALLVTTIVLMEVLMIVQYLRGWHVSELRESHALATNFLTSLPMKVTVFTCYSVATLGVCILYLTNDGPLVAPYMVQAALPLVATLIFGSQSDIFHVCSLQRVLWNRSGGAEIEYTPGGGWSSTMSTQLSPQLSGHVSLSSA
ncbi:hypothetical protein NM688_g2642 [Phlebia brevispora]|uniref:Uncharacterized protein n=1 Tax=Phlebia brevispora TaxID=194682 RepID=A0ACC1T823_9APHY|nr:hypothetical protein NM688_g2642 [Phlebia brevispora]